ncbi:MAG: IS5 family transposase, partial [Burkholderiales bacterium]
RGVPRVDDRRVISGIVHVLKSGGRWADAPDVYGPRKTLYNRFVRWAAKGVWTDVFHALASAGGPPAEVLIDSSAVKAHRCAAGGKGGNFTQEIGRSRGGRTTKIHALTDRFCRPIAFLLTGGQVADCIAAVTLLDQMPKTAILHGDKGYDSDAVRRKIESKGAAPNIPPKANRRWKNCFSPYLYRDRNAIERMFGRLKDFRRIATRYDRLAHNFLAAVCLAATLCYWL